MSQGGKREKKEYAEKDKIGKKREGKKNNRKRRGKHFVNI